MKALILAIFSVTVLTSTAMAGTYEARQDLLRAQQLIQSALVKLDAEDNQEIIASRHVANAQFLCRETATINEVIEAIASAKKEVNAKCDGRCRVALELVQTQTGCKIIAKGYR